MDLIEQYNRSLRSTEDGTLRLLNQVLDRSFNRLVRRVRVHMKAGYADPVQRNLAVLQELRQLVPVFNPGREDAYDKAFRKLLSGAQTQGLAVAGELTDLAAPERPRVDVSIPLDATLAAVSQAKGYLRKHGERFAQTSAEVVAQGIAEGRPTDSVVRDMRIRLGVVKSRAETIVRTESIRAYGEASNTYYAAHGITQVMWYATADDRSCVLCAPRAGQLYNRTEVKVPAHPRCRCFLSPWDPELGAMDPDYARTRERHRREVLRAFRSTGQEPLSLNKASVFEQLAPVPLT